MKRDLIIDVKPTAEELADCFCNLYAGEQVIFFNHIAKLVEGWNKPFCFQMQSVVDNKTLTGGGKSIMRTIGEYGGE